jgi:hypothetical protein
MQNLKIGETSNGNPEPSAAYTPAGKAWRLDGQRISSGPPGEGEGIVQTANLT